MDKSLNCKKKTCKGMFKNAKKWLFLFLIIPFVFWFLKEIELEKIYLFLTKVTHVEIGILFLINAIIFALYCLRWYIILLAMGGHISFWEIVKNRLAGFSVSYVTPGPQVGGEPLQVYLLESRNNIDTMISIPSIFLDRYFDFLANFTFLLFSSIYLSINTQYYPIKTVIILTILITLYLGFFILHLKKIAIFSWLFKLFLPKKTKLCNIVFKVENNIILFLQNIPSLLYLFGISSFIWLLTIYELWFTVFCFEKKLSFYETIAILTTMRLALLTPFPGGIGVLESSQVWITKHLGFDQNIGGVICVFIRIRDLLFIICGFYYLKKLLGKKNI